MPKLAFRDEVRELLGGGAQLVEVLPREEYDEEHIFGAINIPSRSWTARPQPGSTAKPR